MEEKKRKAEDHEAAPSTKRTPSKGPRKWKVPRPGQSLNSSGTIEPGDAGIWVTCVKGKEGKCSADFRELLDEYSTPTSLQEKLPDGDEADPGEGDAGASDIEASIRSELRALKQQGSQSPFELVRVDMPCVVFVKTHAPLEPAPLVHRICADAHNRRRAQSSRYIQRLTPMTATGKATESGLDAVAAKVLAPHFHKPDQTPQKFAIRPTIRYHSLLDRDTVIRQVAKAVGSAHSVDLKHYDLLVLVEIWKNICGMTVVGNDYESLKRYNLLEIYEAAQATNKPGRE